MNIPAEAFAQLYPSDVPPGCLFSFRGSWAVRVTGQANFQGFLMLEGERIGQVFGIAPGMAPAIAIVGSFRWTPMIEAHAKPVWGIRKVPVLALTPTGPIMVGKDSDDCWEETYLAYTMDGHAIALPERHSTAHFDQWSVELCHKDRPFLSLGTILKIDRREES